MNEFQEQLILCCKMVRHYSLDIVKGRVYLGRFVKKFQYILRIALSCADNERSIAPERSFQERIKVGQAQTCLTSDPIGAAFPVFDVQHGAHLVSIACAESAGHEIHLLNHLHIKNSDTHIGYFLDMVQDHRPVCRQSKRDFHLHLRHER